MNKISNRQFFVFLFMLSLSFSSLHADYLNTKISNQCIYDVVPNQNSKGLCYKKRSNNNFFCSTKLRYKHLINGYEYIFNQCVLKNDLKLSGLTQNQLNYQRYMMGNFMGFGFMFMMLFLGILISRR